MFRVSFIISALLLFVACSNSSEKLDNGRRELAVSFLHGVWACNLSVIDDLAAEDVIVSYPIFQSLYGKSVIRGREAVKELAEGFCKQWSDSQLTIHESVVQGDMVVLIWSFQGRSVGPGEDGQPPSNLERSWGGITFYRFNSAGKIIEEIGEESEPGPMQRIIPAQSEE